MTGLPEGRAGVPPLPPWFVPRPGLWRDLAGDGDALVAVVAPAGSGKTALLAEWARHDPAGPTAWVSLDLADADPRRLWSAVHGALSAVGAVPPGDAAVGPGPDDDAADAVLDGLDALRPGVRLVLDDVHLVAGHRPALAALARLVRRHPAGVRLVLAARSDPPAGLARLRGGGALRDVRAGRLRFDLADAGALVAACGVDLAPHDLRVLHRRTDGWAAGLRLAALALRAGRETPAAFLARAGVERSVADYLGEELLAGLPPGPRADLADLAVCARLPAGLARALSGRRDAGARLDRAGRRTGMVERAGPDEHRLHPLLRAHLAGELARRRPTRYRSLHAGAARWWAAQGEAAHALRHAERAGPEPTASLLPRLALRLLFDGDHAALRRALGAAGHDAPGLDAVAALADLAAGLPARAATRLRGAAGLRGTAGRGDADPVLAATGVLVASAAGALAGPIAGPPAGRAEPGPGDAPGSPAGGPEVVALVHLARAAARAGAGSPGAGRADLDAALDLARAHDLAWLEVAVLSWLAVTAVADGDPPAAGEHADAAVAAAGRRGRHPSAWTAVAVAVGALVDVLRGEPERARARCEAVLAAAAVPPQAAYALHAVRGAARGDRDGAVAGPAEARAAQAALGEVPLPAAVAGALATLEHRGALALGDLRGAEDVTARLAARTGETEAVVLARAWEEAAAGRDDIARATVAPLAGTACGDVLVEVRLLEAEAALRAGRGERAEAALREALAAARALDLVRPFVLAGSRTRARVLDRLAEAGHERSGWSERVATACATRGRATPLSAREMVVLALLPSLLRAPDMAAELVVSVNTVKTQIRSIYAKLGVSTRRDAVARARELGLLA